MEGQAKRCSAHYQRERIRILQISECFHPSCADFILMQHGSNGNPFIFVMQIASFRAKKKCGNAVRLEKSRIGSSMFSPDSDGCAKDILRNLFVELNHGVLRIRIQRKCTYERSYRATLRKNICHALQRLFFGCADGGWEPDIQRARR